MEASEPRTFWEHWHKTPLQDLPAGFQVGLWILGAVLTGWPVPVCLGNGMSIGGEFLAIFAVNGAVVLGAYLMMTRSPWHLRRLDDVKPMRPPTIRELCWSTPLDDLPFTWKAALVAGMVVAMLWLLWPRPYSNSNAEILGCGNQVKQWCVALDGYERREGQFPASLEALLHSGDQSDPSVRRCRKDPQREEWSYVLNPAMRGRSRKGIPMPESVPMVWESQPNHRNSSCRNVGFADGRVRQMRESEFERLPKGVPGP